MSFDDVSSKIHIPSSTLRSWENKRGNFTGLNLDQEKAVRILAINKILDQEKSKFNIEVTLVKNLNRRQKSLHLILRPPSTHSLPMFNLNIFAITELQIRQGPCHTG